MKMNLNISLFNIRALFPPVTRLAQSPCSVEMLDIILEKGSWRRMRASGLGAFQPV